MFDINLLLKALDTIGNCRIVEDQYLVYLNINAQYLVYLNINAQNNKPVKILTQSVVKVAR